MRLDGTDSRQHVMITGPGIYFAEEPVPADDARISPDGDWALAHVGNQLHVVAVPQISRAAQTVNVTAPAVPSKQLTKIGADYFGWADGGETITWAVGSTFYTQPFASVEFAAREKAKEDGGSAGEEGR